MKPRPSSAAHRGENSPTASPAPLVPDWENERELHAGGFSLIAGVDEAGRGAWAGPLVAAAVIFPHPSAFEAFTADLPAAADLERLRDSKLLSALVREELIECVRATALGIGVGVVSPSLIDVIGLGPANRLAMVRAVRDLPFRPEFLLIDAFKLPQMPVPQRPLIKGDARCMSIAAASIVAKVTRDRMMKGLHEEHPGYSFARHKGYGTRLHLDALMSLGVSAIHRHSYAPIKAVLGGKHVILDGAADDGADDEA